VNLEVRNIACGYAQRTVVRNISFGLDSGEVFSLLGANGSGKTTLFKAILGLLRPSEGSVLVDGEDIASWSRRQVARTFAYVPQAHTPPFPFSVRDVVLMARAAHLGIVESPGRNDRMIADASLETLGIAHLADAHYTEISGGERQLVLIARALAQRSHFLMMDEPTSNLDFGNQVRVLRHIKELAARGFGLLTTTHVPDHAFLCASRVAVLKDGRLLASGAPDDVLTEGSLGAAYGVALRIRLLEGGMRVCVPEMN